MAILYTLGTFVFAGFFYTVVFGLSEIAEISDMETKETENDIFNS